MSRIAHAERRAARQMRVAGLIISLALMASPGSADQSRNPTSVNEPWVTVLKMQLKESANCVVERILFARELKLGQDVGLEGRVHCVDNREYDFTRRKPHLKFELRLCQPTVC